MSKKMSTYLLLLLMLCSLTLFVGCGKEENPKDKEKENEVVEKQEENNDNKETANNDDNKQSEPKKEEKKKVVLLKRNGVEWKENTSIKSKRGAEKYTVVWGDTLSLIARTWNVNTYTLARYNGIKDIDRIEVGQVIYNYTYKK